MPCRFASGLLALTIFLMLSPALAKSQEGQRAAAQAITGHYYLQGVMETGSELLLDTPDRFQWYLSYGALDLYAAGTWHREGSVVLLRSERGEGLPEPGFETLRLSIRGPDLVPPDGHGAYVLDGRTRSSTPDD
jgi:hypothetical protein